jgi:hypothetical protein
MGIYYGNEFHGIRIVDNTTDNSIIRYEKKGTITKDMKKEIIDALEQYTNDTNTYYVYTSVSWTYGNEIWWDWQRVLENDIYRELAKL